MPQISKRILFLEPYFGGSHKAFAAGYQEHSRHSVELLILPERFWKWRMRGAHLSWLSAIEERRGAFDLLFTCDLLSLAELAGALPWLSSLPKILYMHENQLTYPTPAGEMIDFQFGFTNLSSCLAADRILFNSRFHQSEFLDGIEPFVRRMPDFCPKGLRDRIEPKCAVVPVGCNIKNLQARAKSIAKEPPLTILWNHRWEFDKAPEDFLEACTILEDRGVDFRLVLMGDTSQAVPKPFLAMQERFSHRILHSGYVESYEEYCGLLCRCHAVVSTTRHEFFGISIAEAVAAGCRPFLPRRLVYPEIYGDHPEYHAAPRELAENLERYARELKPQTPELDSLIGEYDWSIVGPRLDALMETAKALDAS